MINDRIRNTSIGRRETELIWCQCNKRLTLELEVPAVKTVGIFSNIWYLSYNSR